MGFGHRVYKNTDPRAKQMMVLTHEVLNALGDSRDPTLRPLLQVAMTLEKEALQDPYFRKRKLFPNVDFYSGITLTAMGIPTSMFTVLFAIGRSVGWIAQWKESVEETGRRISRPRQMYQGEAPKEFVPIDKREGEGVEESCSVGDDADTGGDATGDASVTKTPLKVRSKSYMASAMEKQMTSDSLEGIAYSVSATSITANTNVNSNANSSASVDEQISMWGY